MTGFLDEGFVDLPCPACGYESEVQLRDVRLEARVFCPNCKIEIQLRDDGASMHTALKQIDEALADLQRVFKSGR